MGLRVWASGQTVSFSNYTMLFQTPAYLKDKTGPQIFFCKATQITPPASPRKWRPDQAEHLLAEQKCSGTGMERTL